MRGVTRVLGLLAVASFGLFACSPSTTTGTLNFGVAESLLVLDPNNAASGYVVLSEGTGTCAALQSGLTILGNAQIGNLSYLAFLLGQLDANDNYVALNAGTYTIIAPTDSFNGPGLISNAAALAVDPSCNPSENDATTGTATVSPFITTDGGISSFSYSAVFGGTTVSGTYSLTTCNVPDSTPLADAGTCVVCAGGTPDGGACVIP